MEKTIAEELMEENVKAEGIPNEAGASVEAEPVEKENGGFNLNFLNTPTGPGSIDEYMDHPLNFNESKGMAQIIRGLTGFVDDMALAIIDILVGGFRLFKEKANVQG
ncbi:MAG: hypothetical protein JJE29_00405 [Peptostreptococcaceae bacterium]|nr:hypothetical protein [Peptostreptococcaceae bacterium]